MAKSLATTRMSSKGQVVIPEQIRKQLGFGEGVEFIVVGSGNSIVLKAISAPSMDEFEDLMKHAQTQARLVKLKKADIAKSIKRVRGKK